MHHKWYVLQCTASAVHTSMHDIGERISSSGTAADLNVNLDRIAHTDCRLLFLIAVIEWLNILLVTITRIEMESFISIVIV